MLGVQGLFTPVLSVTPVPIEALLAPAPILPAPELVAAMLVVGDDAFELAAVAVFAQAGLAGGAEDCANADAESAIPIATEAEKISRDIRSSETILLA